MPSSLEFWSSRCPLRDRARWATDEDALCGAYATTAGSGLDATTVVCDPSLAATLLREHDGEAGGLGKPDKSLSGPIGELLRHGLTNAPPGAEWRRQRSACEKALGSVGRLARSADAFAVAAARDAAATLSPAGTGSREVDLKPAVYACAARVMSLIVVGEAHAGTVADALLDVWRCGRVAVGEMDRGTAATAARRLRVAVSAAAAASWPSRRLPGGARVLWPARASRRGPASSGRNAPLRQRHPQRADPIPITRRRAGRALERSPGRVRALGRSPPAQARGRASFDGRLLCLSNIPRQKPSPPAAPSRSRRRNTRSTNRDLPADRRRRLCSSATRRACRLGGPTPPARRPRRPPAPLLTRRRAWRF